jgi:restriction endonuclease
VFGQVSLFCGRCPWLSARSAVRVPASTDIWRTASARRDPPGSPGAGPDLRAGKRYGASKAVGRPEIQEFVGALQEAQADRGIFITTSRFTPEAVTYADRVAARVILIDGLALASLMVRYNIGVQDQQTYVIKRVDEDFFDES